MRQTPNLRNTARERPHLRQRVYSRVLYFGGALLAHALGGLGHAQLTWAESGVETVTPAGRLPSRLNGMPKDSSST